MTNRLELPKSKSTFGQFLADSTGLTRLRALELFRAGYPWPLFTPKQMCQIGLLAQARGLFIDESLAEDRPHAKANYDETLEDLAKHERTQSPLSEFMKEHAIKTLPCLDDSFEHMVKVVALTHEKGSTIVRLFLALQRWANARPGWDQASEVVSAGHEC